MTTIGGVRRTVNGIRALEDLISPSGTAPITWRAFRALGRSVKIEALDLEAWDHKSDAIPRKTYHVALGRHIGADAVAIFLMLANLADGNPGETFTVKELGRLLGCGETTLRRKLDRLKALELVREYANPAGRGSVWQISADL